MMSVAAVHATPAVNHKVRTKFADHTDHIFEYLVAPDPLRLFRCLRIAKIPGSRKVQPHAVSACCRKQFLRADQAKLRRLFGAKIVLTAFVERQSQTRDIRMQSPSKTSER